MFVRGEGRVKGTVQEFMVYSAEPADTCYIGLM